MPVQSKFVLRMVSRTSPLGKWSVHWRWPWKPAAMAPWPPRLFLKAQLGQARVAVHEVAGDDRHLGDELPPVLVLLGVLPLRRVPVLALLEVLADPLVGLLVLFVIVDALFERRVNSVMSMYSLRMPR